MQVGKRLGYLMESESNNVLNSVDHKMDIKIEIKEEPVCPNGALTQIKSEYAEVNDFHSETVFVSSHFVKESVSDSEMCNKIDIKEESLWPESTSNETKQELVLPPAAGVDLKSEIKGITTHTYGECEVSVAEEISRLQIEPVCRYSDSAFYFSRSTSTEETEWRNNGRISVDQMLKEYRAYTIFNSDVKDSLIESCRTTYKSEICGKCFRCLALLKSHNITHKMETLYKCEICSKCFTQPSKLQDHILIHKVKSLHVNEIHKEGFTQIPSLKARKLIHESKRLDICEICNKSFKASNLKLHKLIHEGKKTTYMSHLQEVLYQIITSETASVTP